MNLIIIQIFHDKQAIEVVRVNKGGWWEWMPLGEGCLQHAARSQAGGSTDILCTVKQTKQKNMLKKHKHNQGNKKHIICIV